MKFELTAEEEASWATFQRRHAHKSLKGHVVRTFTFAFTPTGIGNRLSVTCNACGRSKDVTDYDDW